MVWRRSVGDSNPDKRGQSTYQSDNEPRKEIAKHYKIKQDPAKVMQRSGAKNTKSVRTCSTCHGSDMRQVKHFLGQMRFTMAVPTCHGSVSRSLMYCTVCRGSGVEPGEETSKFKIPAGVEDNMQLSMKGQREIQEQREVPGRSSRHHRTKNPWDFFFLRMAPTFMPWFISINFADAALGMQSRSSHIIIGGKNQNSSEGPAKR